MEVFMVQAIKGLGSARWRGLALLVAAATVLLAGCSQLDDTSFGFWDLLWGIVVFFFWFMAIWIFIALFADILRRDDLSGGKKAFWILLLIVLPFIGALIYIVVRPEMTYQDVRLMAQADAASAAASGVSTADELEKLAQLRNSGAISVPEYEQLKAQVLNKS
jgi:hypothetical protein